jgi:hypothetical protein
MEFVHVAMWPYVINTRDYMATWNYYTRPYGHVNKLNVAKYSSWLFSYIYQHVLEDTLLYGHVATVIVIVATQ